MDMDRYIGRLLDNRYEILEVLGSGGMSVVYKARCHRLNRFVAIKILKDENWQDEDFRRRFHAESQAVAMLSHPNIVNVYDVSTNPDADYIVMELIDGITLKQYMEKKGILNWKETLHFATQIAKALEHAHSRGLVHRDIKPHNVMVLKNGSVKVTDFGIARIVSQSNAGTQTKEALGSVHYISPEQAKGGRVDDRSDIYSLGVVMYEMMTGRPPYDGESPVAVAIQHINGGAPMPTELNPNIPKGMEQIIIKAMCCDIRDRYATAADLIQDLEAFRKDPAILFVPEGEGAGEEQLADGEEMPIIKLDRKNKAPAKKQDKNTSPSKDRDDVKAATSRNTAATIAVVVCSLVTVVAIVITLAMMLGGDGLFGGVQQSTVRVPNLVNMKYEQLPDYNGIEVVKLNQDYSDVYAAGFIIRQEPESGTTQPYGTKVFVTVSLGKKPEPVPMPGLEGLTEQAASKKLNDLDLDLQISSVREYNDSVPSGLVLRTDPAAETVLEPGQTVTLYLSKGPEIIKGVMPDLLNKDRAAAQSLLDKEGFTNVEWLPVNSQLPANTVISQSVAAHAQLQVDAKITVVYSNGIPPVGPVTPTDVTISYTFRDLPAKDTPYTVSVLMDGEAVVVGLEIAAGQTEVTVDLTGSGTRECEVYIDGVHHQTVTVDFETDD